MRFCALTMEKLATLVQYDKLYESVDRKAPLMTSLMPPKKTKLKIHLNNAWSPDEKKTQYKGSRFAVLFSSKIDKKKIEEYFKNMIKISNKHNPTQILLGLVLALSLGDIKSFSHS